MVTAKRKYKRSLGKSVKKYKKHVKKHRKHKKHTFTNRVQIGCSNKKNKAMMGGGVNALSQPFENAYYTLTGGISNTYDNFIGVETAPSSSINDQPHLTSNLH
jgi:hypothetical protein